jgi:hypothetical protein
MRISKLALVSCVLLAACSRGEESAEPVGTTVDCAIGAGAEMQAVCVAEQTFSGNEVGLVIHHPDGGFRRFKILPSGEGVELADGAEAMEQRIVEGQLEITFEGARYLVPIDQGSDAPNE